MSNDESLEEIREKKRQELQNGTENDSEAPSPSEPIQIHSVED
ncbi:hypothetical protein [Haloarcula regularis]